MARLHLALLSVLAWTSVTLAAPAFADDAKPVEKKSGEASDPIESANRAVFDGNQYIDRNVLKPMAGSYRETVPGGVQRGVSNVLTNLREPSIAVNDLLQGNPARALSTLWRFTVNTTAGGLGIFDVAADLGLDHHEADFGQTLGVWGAGTGPYLTLPLLGPSNVRDAAGTVVGFVLNPLPLGPAQSAVSVSQALDQRRPGRRTAHATRTQLGRLLRHPSQRLSAASPGPGRRRQGSGQQHGRHRRAGDRLRAGSRTGAGADLGRHAVDRAAGGANRGAADGVGRGDAGDVAGTAGARAPRERLWRSVGDPQPHAAGAVLRQHPSSSDRSLDQGRGARWNTIGTIGNA